MSRPIKQGLDYFPLDIDCFQDKKLARIAVYHGLVAEIVVIKLLMAVYRNGYYLEWDEDTLCALVKCLPGMQPDEVEAIVKTLLKTGFFDPEMFEKHSVLTSRGIQRRFFEATRKRRRRDDLPYLLPEFRGNKGEKEVSAEETRVSAEKTGVSAPESTQSKVKESKAKEKKESQQEKSFCEGELFSKLSVFTSTKQDINTRDTPWHREKTRGAPGLPRLPAWQRAKGADRCGRQSAIRSRPMPCCRPQTELHIAMSPFRAQLRRPMLYMGNTAARTP